MFAGHGVLVMNLLYPVIFYRCQLIPVGCKSLKQTFSVKNGI